MLAELTTLTRAPFPDASSAIELLHASFITHRFSPHMHSEFAIGVVEGGAVRTRVRGGTTVIPAGRLITLNPGDVHTGESASPSGYRYRMLYVPPPLLHAFARCGTWDSPSSAEISFARPVVDDPPLAAQLLRACALVEARIDHFVAESVLTDALTTLAERHGTGLRIAANEPASARVVRLVREYLEDGLTRVVTLAELSKLTGLSAFHVSRTFRSATGLPPYAYLALARVRRARELLAQGCSLSAVTHEAGFWDQSHFTRQFKRVVGVPPGQYARELAVTRISDRGRRHSALPVTVGPTRPPMSA
jgi:AraC-like DNA-binding protein